MQFPELKAFRTGAFLAILLAFGARASAAPAEIDWTRSMAEATRLAGAGKKLIVVHIYADWCPWCKKMEAGTWTDPKVIAESRKYVFLKLNGETDPDGVALRRKFRVSGFPTVMILTAKGEEFERLEGYLDADGFLQALDAAVTDPNSLGNLKIEERRSPKDLQVRFNLGKKLVQRSRFEEAESRFERILEQDPGNKEGMADVSLLYLAFCQAGRSYSEKALATIDRLRKDYPDSKYVPNAWFLSGEILVRMGRKEEARSLYQEFLKKYPEHSLAEQAKRRLAELG